MTPVAISARLIENSSYFEQREALDIRWASFLEKAGLLPVLLPVNYSGIEYYFGNIGLKGLILTGGNDLSIWSSSELSIKRDHFEINLLEYALQHDVPVLGVCRGAQLIAHYFHARFSTKESHVATRHALKSDEGYPQEVNSYHHHCITQLSIPLVATALAEDQSIEAFRHQTKPVQGIMWHPEREEVFRSQDLQQFQSFFQ